MSDPRDERFSRVANLRRRELDHALGCLHPTRPIPVPVTTRLAVSPLVALAPDLVPHLGFERLFQDQLRGQEHQVRTIRRRPQPTIHQGPKALACPLRRGYSLHRDAPCWAPGAKPEARFLIAQAGCIPTEISSNVTPSPKSSAPRIAPWARRASAACQWLRDPLPSWMSASRQVLRRRSPPVPEPARAFRRRALARRLPHRASAKRSPRFQTALASRRWRSAPRFSHSDGL